MAQSISFEAIGAMKVLKGESYEIADLPTTVPPIDIIKIVEAPRIWRADIAQDGTHVEKDGKPTYTKSSDRGIRIVSKKIGVTYNPLFANVPALYREGDEVKFAANTTYTFNNDCIIEYGIRS